MVIPAQISSLTGALIVLVIRLDWSLVMISYTLTISAGVGGLTWITYLALLCRELVRRGYSVFLPDSIPDSDYCYSVCTPHTCFKARKEHFSFCCLFWAHLPAQTEQRTHSPELNSWTRKVQVIWTPVKHFSLPLTQCSAKASQTARDGCTLLSSWGSFPVNAVWAVSKKLLSRRKGLPSPLLLALFLFL